MDLLALTPFLRSQLYLWGSTFFRELFGHVTVLFFNPTIEVDIFRLRGLYKLGAFLLPGFIRLGHERQDLLSPFGGMHV